MKTMLFDFLNKIKSSTVISAGKYGIASAGDFGTVDVGDCGVANVGYRGSASVGENGIAIADDKGKVKGGIGSILVLVRRDGVRKIFDFACAPVDGERIKADTFYTLRQGEFVLTKLEPKLSIQKRKETK